MATNAGTLTIYTNVDTKGVDKGLKHVDSKVKSLRASIARLAGISLTFTGLGKAAINAASDLQEYENVANNTFENLIDKLHEFTESSIKTYGMSRSMATKIASGYQTMGKSIGFANDKATEMSLKLTGLVGNMASFRNISHEQARTALSAVYTGETETLKQYGVMLQEVNLQEFARQHGITKSIAKMTAQEKTILRYNYVLQTLNADLGDFLRTQNNWANQMRVLKESFNELLITIGQNIIPALKPIVQMFNTLIAKVIQFMNVFSAALGKLMGWQYETYEWVEGVKDGAGAMSDLGDETEKAGKKAKKALAPFDDLNVLTQQQKSDSGSGGAFGDFGDGLEGQSGDLKTILNDFESDINSFFELGQKIGDSLTKSLKAIDWYHIFEGAKDFGKNLADFLNGLISPDLFWQVGKTIANSLNTALYVLFNFADNFNWANFGKSIVAAFKGFFDNFNFTLLQNTMVTWAKGLMTLLNNAFTPEVLGQAGDFVGKFVNAFSKMIVEGMTTFDPVNLGTAIATFINRAFDRFDPAQAAEAINLLVSKLVTAIATAIKETDKSQIVEKLKDFLSNLDPLTIAVVIGAITLSLASKLVTAISASMLGLLRNRISSYIIRHLQTIPVRLSAFRVDTTNSIISIIGNFKNKIKTLIESKLASMPNPTYTGPIYSNLNIDEASLATSIQTAQTRVNKSLSQIGQNAQFSTEIAETLSSYNNGYVSLLTDDLLEVDNGLSLVTSNVDDFANVVADVPYTEVSSGLGSIAGGFSSIWTAIAPFVGFAMIIGGVILAVKEFVDMWNNGMSAGKVGVMLLGIAITALGAIILGVSAPVAAVVAAIVAAVALVVLAIKTHWEDIKALFEGLKAWAYEHIAEPLISTVQEMLGPIMTHWNTLKQHLSELVAAIRTLINNLTSWLEPYLSVFINGIWAFMKTKFNIAKTVIKAVVDFVVTILKGGLTQIGIIIDTVIQVFDGLIQFFTGVFTGDWEKAWEGIKQIFKSIWNGIYAILGNVANSIVDVINGVIRSVVNGLNNVINTANSLLAQIPTDILGFTLQIPNISAPQIPHIPIPALATGAVIPPNKEFMAVLGDQKHGTNIEAPLDTIVQAMKIALQSDGYGVSSNQPIELKIDGQTLARLTMPYNVKELHRKGYNVSVLTN